MSKTPHAVVAQNNDYENRRLWVLANAMNLCKALYRCQSSDDSVGGASRDVVCLQLTSFVACWEQMHQLLARACARGCRSEAPCHPLLASTLGCSGPICRS